MSLNPKPYHTSTHQYPPATSILPIPATITQTRIQLSQTLILAKVELRTECNVPNLQDKIANELPLQEDETAAIGMEIGQA